MSNYLITGAAGLIGNRVAEMLLADGHTIAGFGNLNDAYDVNLKQWRVDRLNNHPNFSFYRIDISQRAETTEAFRQAFERYSGFDAVINLAARAGVRQSVENPWVYGPAAGAFLFIKYHFLEGRIKRLSPMAGMISFELSCR